MFPICTLLMGIDDQQRLVLTIGSGQINDACPACGVLAVGYGRGVRVLHDAPCFAPVILLRWLVRIWRCREPLCATQTFTEAHDIAPSPWWLTTRAVDWATSAPLDDTTLSVLAAAGCGLAHLLRCGRGRSPGPYQRPRPAAERQDAGSR
jgi:hypothetical protein